MSRGKGDNTNVKDACSLGILRKDALSHLLNLVLNYHLHLLPNQSELKFLLSIFSLAFALHNVLIILLSCRKRKGEAGTSKQPATKKSKKGGAKKGATASTSTYFDHIEKGCTEPPSELDAELPPSLPAKSK